MRAIKKLDQAIIDTESGKACKYSETLVDWYSRSIAGEEDQIVLPDLQRMRESQARKILKDLKELGIKRFAIMNYGTLEGLSYEFTKVLSEFGYRMKDTVQVLKKVTADYPNEEYDAFLIRAVAPR